MSKLPSKSGSSKELPNDVNWNALGRFLDAEGKHLSLNQAPTRFTGGLANRNYLITLDNQPAVLRCPPPGEHPPGAYDMQREHRILTNLWREFPLAPRALFYCSDKSVLGVPFQINEYRAGLIVRGDELGELALRKNIGTRLANGIIDTLAKLHKVSPEAINLNDLGKPRGFVERSVMGWIRRADLAADGQPSKSAVEVGRWLQLEQVEDTQQPSLLHSDFKLDNMVLNPEDLTPRAVLDWDMGTQGHPLLDLATLISYWSEPGDPDCMHELAQMPTAKAAGFPSRDQVVEMYALKTRCDVSTFPFFHVLALFKLAVVFQQLHRLYLVGSATEERYRTFGYLGQQLMDYALEKAQGYCL